MQLDRCKSCGGDLERRGNYYVCKFCGNKWMIDADNDVHVIDRANAWSALRDCDFERAVELFENIIFKEPENHEAYWGRALASAGIMYVTDLNEHKKVPTCNSISEESFISSSDVQKAISLAPNDISETYKKQAEQIENIRVEWLKKASKEKPYDVFICFKDSDREHNIERTDDSYDAQELYLALTEEGYRVFFSRVSLRNKVAEHYEPYIYNALKTAKVMIVFGEKPEYFNAVWVKNEWTRFRAMIERGKKDKNSLVTVYKNMSPNDLPAGLRSRQSLDAAEIKFFDILTNHIDKIINAPKERTLVDDFVPEPPKKKKKWPIIATIAGILALAITLGFLAPNFINVKGDETTGITEETELEDTETELGSNQESQIETSGSKEIEEQSETNAETSSSAEFPTTTETETTTDTETESETETVTESKTLSETTTEAESNTETESEPENGSTITPTVSTITFDPNGGSGTMSAQQAKTNEEVTLKQNLFTREGYMFAGWATSAAGNVAYVDGATYTMGTERQYTLFAIWIANKYTVKLADTSNDPLYVTVTMVFTDDIIETVKLKNGQKLQHPGICGMENMISEAWYTDDTYTTRYDFSLPITKDITIYLGWATMLRPTQTYEQIQILSPEQYVKDAYALELDVLYSKNNLLMDCYVVAQESGSHTISFKNASSSYSKRFEILIYNITQNRSVYQGTCYSTAYDDIVFSCNKYDVIVISFGAHEETTNAYLAFEGFYKPRSSAYADIDIDADSEYYYSSGDSSIIEVTYDDYFELPSLSRDGYTFLGWYYGNERINDETYKIASNITLVPKWQKN